MFIFCSLSRQTKTCFQRTLERHSCFVVLIWTTSIKPIRIKSTEWPCQAYPGRQQHRPHLAAHNLSNFIPSPVAFIQGLCHAHNKDIWNLCMYRMKVQLSQKMLKKFFIYHLSDSLHVRLILPIKCISSWFVVLFWSIKLIYYDYYMQKKIKATRMNKNIYLLPSIILILVIIAALGAFQWEVLFRNVTGFRFHVGHPWCTRMWCRRRHHTHSLLAEVTFRSLSFALLPAGGVSPYNPIISLLRWTLPRNSPVYLRASVWPESGMQSHEEKKINKKIIKALTFQSK